MTAKAKELASAAAAKKAELEKEWEEFRAELPKKVADIKSCIATLCKSRKLPKGLDKAKLESAKSGMDELGKSWDEANQAFQRGSVADAVAKAKAAKEKAAEIMATLGMKAAGAGKG